MKYFEFTFHTSPCTETVNDVLTAVLGEVGFESFVECEGGLTAYIQQSVCDENAIKTVIAEFPLSDTEITYTFTEAEDKDWNEEWEKNFFQPIIIGDGVCKMADHSALAGSLATMDVLVRTMVKKANIPLEDAVRMASETPARLIGVSDRKGALAKGLDADIVILDKELNVRCVWSMGKIVPGTDVLLHK